MNNQDLQAVENLEHALVRQNIPFDQIRHHQSLLIESLFNEKYFGDSPCIEIPELAQCILSAAQPNAELEILRQEWVERLWRISDKYQIMDGRLSAITRSIICCLCTEKRWFLNHTADNTPFFYYWFFLQIIDPALTDRFLRHHRTLLDGRSYDDDCNHTSA